MSTALVADRRASGRAIAPGPKGSFLLGNAPRMRRDPIALLVEAARDFGDVTLIHEQLRNIFLVVHPDDVRQVLVDKQTNYQKGFGYADLEPLVGKGLLTSEGDHWKKQRRLVQPAFHRQCLRGFGDVMVRRTLAMVERWSKRPKGERMDVHQEMLRLTLGIAGETLFSVDLEGSASAVGRAMSVALEITNRRLTQFVVPPGWIPTPQNRRFNKALAVLDTMVSSIIEERRRSDDEHPDLLGMLMAARDEESGDAMSDRQLRDEVMTMALAGHETSASGLTWIWYLLSLHPAVERKLHEELERVLRGRPPTMADLASLEYTAMVVDEAMRLYPPLWLIGRKTLEDDEIGGYTIPARSAVLLCPYITHRDGRFWDNPEGFDPERFAPHLRATRHRTAYFPFAAGSRMCIGNHFATMEMQLALATVAQRYRLPLLAGHRVELEPRVTLRPRQGLLVTPQARV